ncbi:fatty acyl-AMP ligase [Pseudonocardia sp. CA-107938]|uniref:fatty acyl-AMP ligase n=1 Tax=Pseudonocardia sp. CA-107938 TaxID=3240021 RepID=UPI003D8BACB2
MSRFLDMLLDAAVRTDRGMTTGEPKAPVRRTWAEVHETALGMAAALQAGSADRPGLVHGAAVGVLAGEPATIAPAAQAVWLTGGSVTMLHQPTPRTDLAAWAEDTLAVLKMIDAQLVLLGAPFDAVAPVLAEHGIAFRTLDELTGAGTITPDASVAGADDTALLQLTSGSTAEPKAVRITHGNLHANITAMMEAAELDVDNDRMVSWLPLFHDMGMVGFLTVPMVTGLELITVTPVDFLGRPLLWAELISKYGGTVTAAPNFAYAVLARQLARADGPLDLSTLRIALNGAEPIDATAVAAFVEAGARFGLHPEAVLAAYGMAETALGVAFAPVFTGLDVDEIDAEQLEAHRRAVPGTGRTFPKLGPPLPGIEVRVVADDGTVRGEREVGILQLRGPSVTPGYLTVNGPVATQDAEGWLDTGDEGYLVDGQVVVCGRRKDVIIMGGRNIYPTDIERAAAEAADVRAGNAVAVRLSAGDGRRRETFAVVVESRKAGDADAEAAIRKDVTGRVFSAVGVRPAEVVVLGPGSLPKTPSGKLRRAATADLVAARSTSHSE